MKYKLVIPMMILSVILAGCISGEQSKNVADKEKKITIKYIDGSPIITKENFPDFNLLDRIYYIAQENISVTLEVEGIHRENMINSSDNVPEGYRIYGVSEAHNSSKNASKHGRYILLQYKVFDNNENLNDSMNLTAFEYTRKGFKNRFLNNSTYKERIFIFESNVTNSTDENVTIILFGYDTLLGKIGVQDSKDRSLVEALKILDMVVVSDRLKINTKEVNAASIETYPGVNNKPYNKTHGGAYNTTSSGNYGK